MSKDKEKELDDFFRKGLSDPGNEAGYREEDWDALEEMMDRPKRRGIVFWLPYLGSVAALLLLFLGWWAYRPTVAHHQQPRLQAVTGHQQMKADTNSEATQQPKGEKQSVPVSVNYAKNNKPGTANIQSKPFVYSLAVVAGHDSAGIKNNAFNQPDGSELAAVSSLPGFGTDGIGSQAVKSFNLQLPEVKKQNGATGLKITGKAKPRFAYRPQYALSILAAPDVNGVGSSFQQGKVGTNIGLLFTAGVSKKFTISTGAMYSVKPYITSFANYHTQFQFSENPINVAADCRMLDIPINVGYQVYNKHQNKLSIGTGLSSYIMLHESYKFNYADYSDAPASYTVPNSNKYFFGVLNLNATYQHQVNSKVGVSIQPYMKLPLTNIGYSQVRLQTTGVAVGLTWNLNSLKKP